MMHVFKGPRTLIALGLGLMLAVPAGASTLYRYNDEAGNPVISHTMPQEASQRGYEILTPNGRIIETVPPALTDAQRATRKAEEQARAAEAERQAQQRERDRQLLRTFSHPDDVVRALKRKLEEMGSLISLKQGNITSARAQIRHEQSRAADIERTGGEIPEQILTRIADFKAEIRQTEAEIRRQREEIAAVVEEYTAKTERVEYLTETRRTQPLPAIPTNVQP